MWDTGEWDEKCHYASVMMMMCMWTSLTSHDLAEIDHIRLLFFQIRVENLKRGPPGFQFFVYFMTFFVFSVFCLFYDVFDVIWPENQLQCSILSQRGSTQLCLGCFDLRPGHKIIYNWKPGGHNFPFSTLIWRNDSLIWSISAQLYDVRGSQPAYHHPVVYGMYFE